MTYKAVHHTFQIICFIAFLLLNTTPAKSSDKPYLNTGLPVCFIEISTSVSDIPRFEYIPATICVVSGADTLLAPTQTTIAGRGNSTWGYPKKPYKLKFSKKTAILGMTPEKTFSLLANYCDKSLMRTAIGFTVGRAINQPWVPNSRFVELVINNVHLGTYQLTESVKVSDTRVQLNDTGFLIEYDTHYAQANYYFHTQTYNYPIAFKHPDNNIDANLYTYTKQYMDAFEQALDETDFLTTRHYADYIDIQSFAKWYYQKNVLQMEECNRYYQKADTTANSRLCMGPLWDFEWCLGIGLYYDSIRPNPNHRMENKLYFRQIAQDPVFMAEVAKLHVKYRDAVRDSVLNAYDQLTEQLAISQAENFKLWPILDKQVSIGAYPLGSWEAEVACDRQFFLNHLDYLDKILLPYLPTNISNPANVEDGFSSPIIYTLSGQRVDSQHLTKGIYIINGKKVMISK